MKQEERNPSNKSEKVLDFFIQYGIYLIVLLVLFGVGFVKELSGRVNALERSDSANLIEHQIISTKVDGIRDDTRMIRCLLGDKFIKCDK